MGLESLNRLDLDVRGLGVHGIPVLDGLDVLSFIALDQLFSPRHNVESAVLDFWALLATVLKCC